MITHTLAPASGPRIRELIELWSKLVTCATLEADECYAALATTIARWNQADHLRALRDNREFNDERLARWAEYARRSDGVEATSLIELNDSGSFRLPAFSTMRVESHLKRLRRFDELKAPPVILDAEVAELELAISSWRTPPPSWNGIIDWRDGGQWLLKAGLSACADGVFSFGGTNLGLGPWPGLHDLLGLSEEQMRALHTGTLATDSNLSSWPWVPTGRFGPNSRPESPSTAACLGWCADTDVVELVQAIADRMPASHSAWAQNWVAEWTHAASRGSYALGCLEWLQNEAKNRQQWIVGPLSALRPPA